MEKTRVIFVCLGNICRSPMAKALFLAKLKDRGVSEQFEVDSAGTSGYHVGESPDPGAVRAAKRAGIDISGDRSSRITRADMGYYDYVIALDRSNYSDLARLAPEYANRIHLLRDFEPGGGASVGSGVAGSGSVNSDKDVPDPWGQGDRSFERSFDIVERSTAGLLEFLLEKRGVR